MAMPGGYDEDLDPMCQEPEAIPYDHCCPICTDACNCGEPMGCTHCSEPDDGDDSTYDAWDGTEG
jgi:hypothetical protein